MTNARQIAEYFKNDVSQGPISTAARPSRAAKLARAYLELEARYAALEGALRSIHWHFVEGTANREIIPNIISAALDNGGRVDEC